jgi:WD40 repeat protein
MGDIRLWDLYCGVEIRRFNGHVHYAWSVAFSPDGTRLLSGGDKTVYFWDVDTAQLLRSCPVSMTANRVQFSGDGRTAMVTNNMPLAHLIRSSLVDLQSGEELFRFGGGYPELALARPDVIADTRFGRFEIFEVPPASAQKSVARSIAH